VTSCLRIAVLVLFACTILAMPCHAQSVPSATAQSGRLLEDRFPAAPPEPRSQPPRPKVAPAVPLMPDATQPGPRFVLHKLIFDGNTVYSGAKLQELAANLLGQSIAVADLQALAGRITSLYRNDGYLLSSAAVPEQEISNGIVKIQITEGALANIVFDGLNPEDASASLLASIAYKLLEIRPLRQDVLETTLLLINDIEGVTASAIFKPSPLDPGQIDLIIPVSQEQYRAQVEINNRGSHYVGPFQMTGTGSYYGTLSRFDTVRMQVLTGTDNQELLGIQAEYIRPLNASGTTVNVRLGKVWSEPGYTLRPFSLESINQSLSVGITQPIMRTRAENLKVTGNMGTRYSRTKIDGALFSEDDYRSVESNIEYDIADPSGGVTLFNIGAAQGLDIFGGNASGKPLLTRQDGKSDFTKLTFYGSRSQFLIGKTSLFAAVSGQYALSQLLAAEEFGYGGATFGRAYDPSELTGDHGAALLLELRHTLDLDDEYALPSVQLFASYDFGSVWNIDDETKGPQMTGASAGAGVRFSVLGWLSGSLQVVRPLTRPVGIYAEDDNKDVRLFATMQIDF
jgi:hemolysin activation/secretion protein